MKNMREYWRLVEFSKSHIKILVLAVVCMLISAVFNGVSLGMIVPIADKILTDNKIVIKTTSLPPFILSLIDKINAASPIFLLNASAIAIIVLIVLKSIFAFLQSYYITDLALRVTRDIRKALFVKFQTLSLDYFAHKKIGHLMSRITYDVGTTQNSISEGLTDLFYQSFQVVLFTIIIFAVHWRLAIVSFILLPLIVLPILKIGKILRKMSARSQQKVGDINTTIFETLSGLRIVKAFLNEPYEIARFSSFNQDYYKIMLKSNKRMLAIAPVTEFIGAIGGVFVFTYGGREVISGRLSLGVFVMFIAALLSLIRPFKRLGRVYTINEQTQAAAERIFEVLDTKPSVVEKDRALVLDPIKRDIVFEDVWFRYGETDVLREINLKVARGEVVAIVGPSGVGKTTLVDLIPRFYDPTRGAIKIDGVDTKDATLSSLRAQIGLVTQETILFNDTVMANVKYGKLDATDDEVIEACKIANAHDFIFKLPRQYETSIGDRGFALSGGERQRLAIARAVLKNPPILILDEATSALDTESERLVQSAIERLMQGRTVFVIAHRLSTVRNADKIVVLEGGRVVRVGRHEELLEEDGLYKKLYNLQFQE